MSRLAFKISLCCLFLGLRFLLSLFIFVYICIFLLKCGDTSVHIITPEPTEAALLLHCPIKHYVSALPSDKLAATIRPNLPTGIITNIKQRISVALSRSVQMYTSIAVGDKEPVQSPIEWMNK